MTKPSFEQVLDKCGIPAVTNKRTEPIFTVRIDRGKIRFVLTPTAEVEVLSTSKKHRQAVVKVTEPKRQVTREVWYSRYNTPRPERRNSEPAREATETEARHFQNSFPITFPDSAQVTWEVKDVHATQEAGSSYQKFTAKVTAKVSASKQVFLMGYDESHLFVSMLPTRARARTVAEAHKALRPKGVTNAAVRQGEWFFEPVNDTLRSELDGLVEKNPGCLDGDTWGTPLTNDEARNTSHYCTHVEHKGKRYAIGWVTDRAHNGSYGPRFRTRHHKPLLLMDWHRVIHNTEQQQATDNASWD